jgi:hypothetical protein
MECALFLLIGSSAFSGPTPMKVLKKFGLAGGDGSSISLGKKTEIDLSLRKSNR